MNSLIELKNISKHYIANKKTIIVESIEQSAIIKIEFTSISDGILLKK